MRQRRKDVAGLDEDSEVYDFHRGLSRTQQSQVSVHEILDEKLLSATFDAFTSHSNVQIDPAAPVAEGSPVRRCIYTLADVPGKEALACQCRPYLALRMRWGL